MGISVRRGFDHYRYVAPLQLCLNFLTKVLPKQDRIFQGILAPGSMYTCRTRDVSTTNRLIENFLHEHKGKLDVLAGNAIHG